MDKKDLQKIRHIEEYCNKINCTIQRFGGFDALKNDVDYYQSITMSLLQIGELSHNLTEDFKIKSKNEIPWVSIRAVRNMCAHEYGKVDKEEIWEISNTDIPKLKQFCKKTIDNSERI